MFFSILMKEIISIHAVNFYEMICFKRVELAAALELVGPKYLIEQLQALQRCVLTNAWKTSISTESKDLSIEGTL